MGGSQQPQLEVQLDPNLVRAQFPGRQFSTGTEAIDVPISNAWYCIANSLGYGIDYL